MTTQSPTQDAASRDVVGIDLGTTNSAVAYVDSADDDWRVQTFAVPQLVAPGVVEARETLPSFHYQATRAEAKDGMLRLPWGKANSEWTVGVFAREEGIMAGISSGANLWAAMVVASP